MGTNQQLLLVQYSCSHSVINPQFVRNLFIRMLQYLHCEWGNLLKEKLKVTLEQAIGTKCNSLNIIVYWYIYNHRCMGYMFRLLLNHLQALKEYKEYKEYKSVPLLKFQPSYKVQPHTYVIRTIVRINGACFLKQHKLNGLYNGDGLCSLWGTNYILYNSMLKQALGSCDRGSLT